MVKLFSAKSRPLDLGPYPLERLARGAMPDVSAVPGMSVLDWDDDRPESLTHAMRDFQAMLDAIRDGIVNPVRGTFPDDRMDRARQMKAFATFQDAPMCGICALTQDMVLDAPRVNPWVASLAQDLQTKQTKTLAAGIDLIMADLKDSMAAPPKGVEGHTHGIVLLYDYGRDPAADEPGGDWIGDAQAHRASLRAMETAVVLANFIRALGHRAKAHSLSATDVDLNRMAVAAGLATSEMVNPFVGDRFQCAVVTTDLDMAVDLPLAPDQRLGWRWAMGAGSQKSALNGDAFARRRYMDGPHPFETLKRVPKPTTFIDEPNVARVPKRADMFARAQFGDMGPDLQKAATGGYYVRKAGQATALRRPLGAFVVMQDGDRADAVPSYALNPKTNADAIKAVSYFLGADAVGISRCPDWAWYSHDATGAEIHPTQHNAISMIIDQGFETTEGSSGDDWIAVTQSMRAYLRFSLIGSVVARLIRNMGYQARAHTVMDGEVLQPPLLLLSGLGEVSRIGEVIVNPFLGPRLKSGVVTTDMPMDHDLPIDFGMQAFCEACNKCARECPSGAITAGPKLMFNGYEIWKSDSQKCTTYRVTNPAGAMCGRCMKTCPWNVEGLLHEGPIRWTAMNIPAMAPLLAWADDKIGNGAINPAKKWWWDLKLNDQGGYDLVDPVTDPPNIRNLQPELDLKYEDQTLAVYPAGQAPHPWPFPDPMDREQGIEAYQAMITAKEYQARKARGETGDWDHQYRLDGDSPVLRVEVTRADAMADGVTKYEFQAVDGSDLPEWTAGAHLDIVVAPEFLRQYSMSGDPADRSKYQIGVLREDDGRGGSKLLHRIFEVGRKVFISKPINHFPRQTDARKHYFMGGGIGVTPMIAMAHEAFAAGDAFELHYSITSRKTAGYLQDLASVPWADRVRVHVSDEGTRAVLTDILSYRAGHHVYTCGPEPYMSAVIAAATTAGFPEDARHLEYFSVPEMPDRENHAFTLRLSKSGRDLAVGPEQSAADVLNANGFKIDVKCSDGLCGVCQCGVVSGEVDHRDFVLSKAQRADRIILCQSRAADPDGMIEIDL